jgi:hypothetical protein
MGPSLSKARKTKNSPHVATEKSQSLPRPSKRAEPNGKKITPISYRRDTSKKAIKTLPIKAVGVPQLFSQENQDLAGGFPPAKSLVKKSKDEPHP